jgi:membrane fusion protein, multidrug efflux system
MIEQQTLATENSKDTPRTGRRRSVKGLLVPAVLLVVIAIVSYALLQKTPSAAQAAVNAMPTPNIRTATVRRGSLGQYIEAIGTVTPLATVNLYSQVNGQVIAVHYVEGQIVHRGGSAD